MSREVIVQFEVRDMLIMKDTLNQMGYDFTEVSPDFLEMQLKYKMTINAAQGVINFDSDDTRTVNKIRQNYMTNFYRDQAIREGNDVETEVQENGEIILRIM